MKTLFALLLATTATAADTYQPSPLNLLEARVDEHDQQICDLDERLKKLETNTQAAVETKDQTVTVRVVVDKPPPLLVATSAPLPKAKPVVVSKPTTVARSVVRTTTRRRTTSELQSAIAAAWTSRVYGRMAAGQERLVYRHLTTTHGYTPSQVNGLPLDYALMLHNLAHGPKVSPYTKSATVQAADFFQPTPRTPVPSPPTASPVPRNNCANGRCFRSTSRTVTRTGGWYPGKLLGF